MRSTERLGNAARKDSSSTSGKKTVTLPSCGSTVEGISARSLSTTSTMAARLGSSVGVSAVVHHWT